MKPDKLACLLSGTNPPSVNLPGLAGGIFGLVKTGDFSVEGAAEDLVSWAFNAPSNQSRLIAPRDWERGELGRGRLGQVFPGVYLDGYLLQQSLSAFRRPSVPIRVEFLPMREGKDPGAGIVRLVGEDLTVVIATFVTR